MEAEAVLGKGEWHRFDWVVYKVRIDSIGERREACKGGRWESVRRGEEGYMTAPSQFCERDGEKVVVGMRDERLVPLLKRTREEDRILPLIWTEGRKPLLHAGMVRVEAVQGRKVLLASEEEEGEQGKEWTRMLSRLPFGKMERGDGQKGEKGEREEEREGERGERREEGEKDEGGGRNGAAVGAVALASAVGSAVAEPEDASDAGTETKKREKEEEKLVVGTGEECCSLWMDAIASSTRKVDASAFGMSEPRILTALYAAAGRGCRVRLLLDAKNQVDRIKILPSEGENMEVRYALRRGRGILHHKMLIVDDETLVLGSFNPTLSALSNLEHCLFLRSPSSANAASIGFSGAWGESETNGRMDSLQTRDRIVPQL